MRPTKFSLAGWERLFLFLVMLSLIVLSLVFYKERVLFNDTLKLVTDMFDKKGFNVTTNRYISIFAEMLPLAAFKAGASLNAVLLLYSLNLILIPVALSLISMFWFRETRTAWSILLFYIIMSARLTYYPVSEFQYGLAFFLFYIGLCDHTWRSALPAGGWAFWLLSLFFIPTVIFSHPLSTPTFFAWVVLRLSLYPRQWKLVMPVALLGILAQAAKMIFFSFEHDANKSQKAEAFKRFDLTFLDTPIANDFYKAMRDDYFFVPLLLVLAVSALVYWRKYLAAVVLPGITLGFWLLVTVSLFDERYWYYSEHIYQPVSFFIALGAARYFGGVASRRIYFPVLAVVAIFSVNKIYLGHEPMTRRLDWYRNAFQLMGTKGITKGVVGIDYMDIGWPMAANWLTQYESAYLYALEHTGTTKTVTMVWNEQNARAVTNQGDALIGVSLDLWPVRDFPKQYFHFDTSHYAVLTDVFGEEQVRRLSYEKPKQ